MPLNILRLNQRLSHPNDRITFIKPLPGPDSQTAEDLLRRIAAQCLPIMKTHHLSVTTLEEHEPNHEFVGRNFNNGEVIQLVLRGRGSSRWLPFGYVQMVMMHELAHCLQMNHSSAFWKLRNTYAAEMRVLWSKGYTGEGIWGRGRLLCSGQPDGEAALTGTDIPEHLCGGTYRTRRGKKRKSGKQELSYKEREEKRIRKKFGTDGKKLGADEAIRRGLENNRWNPAAPRVAASKRGRELRAAALLDRLNKAKAHESSQKVPDEESESETDNDYSADDETATDSLEIIRHDGKRMFRTCGDEDETCNADALQEVAELNSLPSQKPQFDNSQSDKSPRDAQEQALMAALLPNPNRSLETENHSSIRISLSSNQVSETTPAKRKSASEPGKHAPDAIIGNTPSSPTPSKSQSQLGPAREHAYKSCPICSLENGIEDLRCAACAHVLDTSLLPRFWRCPSTTCADSLYVNASDAGRCGICGEPQP